MGKININAMFSRFAFKALIDDAMQLSDADRTPQEWTVNEIPHFDQITPTHENFHDIYYCNSHKNFADYDVEKSDVMISWWMDSPFSKTSDKDLYKLVICGFRQNPQQANHFYPIIKVIYNYDELDFSIIQSFIKDFNTKIDFSKKVTYTPSEYKTSTETVRSGTKQVPQTQYSTKYVTRENPHNHLSGSLEFETKAVVTEHTTYKTVDNYKNQTRSYWTKATLDQYFYFESCSEEETADFAKVLQNQAEIKELYNKHENIGFIHIMEKKKIREKIHKLFEFNYYVIGKAFVDRVAIDFNEEIAAIERWISYEKSNHRRLKKDFNTNGLGYHGLEDYGHVVSHNHSALPKAKKRKAEIDACYAEICNKIASLRNI